MESQSKYLAFKLGINNTFFSKSYISYNEIISKGVDSMDNERSNCCQNCIADILKVIIILQQGANQIDSCLETCDRGFLGQQCCPTAYNTRPIVLYMCGANSTPFSVPISKSPTETTSSFVFRVEKIDSCCATCRVLIVNSDNTYTSTNSFFTINLDCVCGIRCLDDTYIEGV